MSDQQHGHINPWLIAVSVMFATFMEVLDTTVVNVSLPHIAGSLSATIDEATWALTSYLVANAIILPMTGWLATRFGRKRLLMLSVVGFPLSSFLCGLAPTLGMLILFRIMQGATGGALQPLSQAVLLEAFPPHDRGKIFLNQPEQHDETLRTPDSLRRRLRQLLCRGRLLERAISRRPRPHL